MNLRFRTPLQLVIFLACVGQAALTQISVIGELSQDRLARVGDVYEGTLTVRNETREPQDAKIYQTDYTFNFQGLNTYGEPAGKLPRSNAKWITFNPSFLTIPPTGSVTVNYRVTVPRDSAGLSGTYWSMLMVEGIPKGSLESSVPPPSGKKEMGVMQTIRYGVQLATHIHGTGTRSVKFLGAQIALQPDSSKVLHVDVENDGQIGFRPEVHAEVYDGQGVSRAKLPGQRYRLYPGTSVRQRFEIGGLAPGSYKILVVVDAGGDEAFAAEYTLKL